LPAFGRDRPSYFGAVLTSLSCLLLPSVSELRVPHLVVNVYTCRLGRARRVVRKHVARQRRITSITYPREQLPSGQVVSYNARQRRPRDQGLLDHRRSGHRLRPLGRLSRPRRLTEIEHGFKFQNQVDYIKSDFTYSPSRCPHHALQFEQKLDLQYINPASPDRPHLRHGRQLRLDQQSPLRLRPPFRLSAYC